ncbi:hypothetical protein ACU686_31980 [Yinghuangia aomiensis]
MKSDGPGDPRVGAAGASYGGALALLLAAYDPRVDAVAQQWTWNDLAASLLPNAGGTGGNVRRVPEDMGGRVLLRRCRRGLPGGTRKEASRASAGAPGGAGAVAERGRRACAAASPPTCAPSDEEVARTGKATRRPSS